MAFVTCMQVMTQGGPWHARRLAFGDAHMEQLYSLFLAQLDKQQQQQQGMAAGDACPRTGGACGQGVTIPPQCKDSGPAGLAAAAVRQGPIMHSPKARLLVLRRRLGPVGLAGMRVKL